MKEQLLQLQKIAKELNDAIVGLQAEWAWREKDKEDAMQPTMRPPHNYKEDDGARMERSFNNPADPDIPY